MVSGLSIVPTKQLGHLIRFLGLIIELVILLLARLRPCDSSAL